MVGRVLQNSCSLTGCEGVNGSQDVGRQGAEEADGGQWSFLTVCCTHTHTHTPPSLIPCHLSVKAQATSPVLFTTSLFKELSTFAVPISSLRRRLYLTFWLPGHWNVCPNSQGPTHVKSQGYFPVLALLSCSKNDLLLTSSCNHLFFFHLSDCFFSHLYDLTLSTHSLQVSVPREPLLAVWSSSSKLCMDDVLSPHFGTSCKLMAPKLISSAYPPLQFIAHKSNCLLDISTWMSLWHHQFNMLKKNKSTFPLNPIFFGPEFTVSGNGTIIHPVPKSETWGGYL